MPFIDMLGEPVLVRFEHDGVPIDHIVDDQGPGPLLEWDIFEVRRVHFQNFTGNEYELEVEPEGFPPINHHIGPFETGDTGNIPPPQRFPTEPVKTRVSRA